MKVDSFSKMIFVHIPRTAGRFVEQNLEAQGWVWDDDIAVVKQYKSMEGIEVAHFHNELYLKHFDDLGSIPHFTVVRNPIDRFFSCSIFLKRMYGDDIQEAMEDPVMFHSMLENFPLTQAVNWFRPQVDFLTDDTNIWKFEDGFGEDFSEWLSEIVGAEIEIKKLTKDYTRNNVGQKLILEYFEKDHESNKLDRSAKLVNNITALYRHDIEQLYPELATPFEEGT